MNNKYNNLSAKESWVPLDFEEGPFRKVSGSELDWP
jgi:hypothetical protein